MGLKKQAMTASCQNCLSWGNAGDVSHPLVLEELIGVTSPQGILPSAAMLHFISPAYIVLTYPTTQ